MAANRVAQLKQPLSVLYGSSAQKYPCFYSHILNGFAADYLVNIHTQQLMFFILHAKPQGSDITIGAAYADHVNGTAFLFHSAHILSTSF